MSIARLNDFIAGTPIVSAQVDAEFDQLCNLLNGTSTDKDVTLTLSHSVNPPLTLNQTGTGPIQAWKKSGTEKARFNTDGGLNIGHTTAVDALNKLGINLDTDPGNILVALRTLNVSDQGIRIIMDGATSGSIPAFSVYDDDGGTSKVFIRASGEIRVGAGYPTNLADCPSKQIVLGGQAYQSVTPVGNVTTGDDDLQSHTIAANVLANDGDTLDFGFSGSFAANANNKRLKVHFGGSNVLASTFTGFNGLVWCIRGTVTRIDPDTVIVSSMYMISGTEYATYVETVNSLDFTTTLVLKASGEGTDTDDVVNSSSFVRKYGRAQ